jgi:hypothetical protein
VRGSGAKRYRLNAEEVIPVLGLVKERLTHLIEAEEDLTEAEQLFKVLYRFETYRVGRPSYPDPINWEIIGCWMGENGPFLLGESFDSVSVEK